MITSNKNNNKSLGHVRSISLITLLLPGLLLLTLLLLSAPAAFSTITDLITIPITTPLNQPSSDTPFSPSISSTPKALQTTQDPLISGVEHSIRQIPSDINAQNVDLIITINCLSNPNYCLPDAIWTLSIAPPLGCPTQPDRELMYVQSSHWYDEDNKLFAQFKEEDFDMIIPRLSHPSRSEGSKEHNIFVGFIRIHDMNPCQVWQNEIIVSRGVFLKVNHMNVGTSINLMKYPSRYDMSAARATVKLSGFASLTLHRDPESPTQLPQDEHKEEEQEQQLLPHSLITPQQAQTPRFLTFNFVLGSVPVAMWNQYRPLFRIIPHGLLQSPVNDQEMIANAMTNFRCTFLDLEHRGSYNWHYDLELHLWVMDLLIPTVSFVASRSIFPTRTSHNLTCKLPLTGQASESLFPDLFIKQIDSTAVTVLITHESIYSQSSIMSFTTDNYRTTLEVIDQDEKIGKGLYPIIYRNRQLRILDDAKESPKLPWFTQVQLQIHVDQKWWDGGGSNNNHNNNNQINHINLETLSQSSSELSTTPNPPFNTDGVSDMMIMMTDSHYSAGYDGDLSDPYYRVVCNNIIFAVGQMSKKLKYKGLYSDFLHIPKKPLFRENYMAMVQKHCPAAEFTLIVDQSIQSSKLPWVEPEDTSAVKFNYIDSSYIVGSGPNIKTWWPQSTSGVSTQASSWIYTLQPLRKIDGVTWLKQGEHESLFGIKNRKLIPADGIITLKSGEVHTKIDSIVSTRDDSIIEGDNQQTHQPTSLFSLLSNLYPTYTPPPINSRYGVYYDLTKIEIDATTYLSQQGEEKSGKALTMLFLSLHSSGWEFGFQLPPFGCNTLPHCKLNAHGDSKWSTEGVIFQGRDPSDRSGSIYGPPKYSPLPIELIISFPNNTHPASPLFTLECPGLHLRSISGYDYTDVNRKPTDEEIDGEKSTLIQYDELLISFRFDLKNWPYSDFVPGGLEYVRLTKPRTHILQNIFIIIACIITLVIIAVVIWKAFIWRKGQQMKRNQSNGDFLLLEDSANEYDMLAASASSSTFNPASAIV